MKKLFALLALLPAMASAQCNVYFSIRDFGLDPLGSNTVRMIATNSTPAVSSTNVIANDWKQYRTSTNGFVTFTNCRAYAYHVLISGPNSTTTFKIQGMPTDGSTVNGADYIVPVVSPSITSYLAAGTNIYLKTNSGVLSINFTGTNALLTNVTLHATSNASPVNALGQTSDGKVVKIALATGGSGDAGGTNARQFGTLAGSNIVGLASFLFTNVPAGGSNISLRTVGGTNFFDTTGQLNNWAQLSTNDIANLHGATNSFVKTTDSRGHTNSGRIVTTADAAIGTNSPSHKLSVAGNFGAAPNEGTYQFVVAADTGALNIGEGEAELKPGEMILKYSGPVGIKIINNDLDTVEPQFRVTPGSSITVVSNNGPYYSGTVTPSRVALWDAARGLTNSANVDATELGYSDGLTGAIQTQLDGKAGNGVTNSFVKTQDTRGHTNTGTVRLEATSSTAAILPLAHITYDFGSLALQWRTGYFDSLRASNINALVSITTDTLNADELVLTNNPFQAGSATLTNLSGNPIPFTNILVAGWGQALTTNSGVVTVTATNRGASIATNATSTTVGFSDTENVQIYNTWWHLTTNLVVSPTNLVVGRTICIRFDTNSLTYDVTVTNTAANPVNWNFNVSTNGQTSFTKTNTLRARLYLTAETNGVISADFGYYR